jgi:nucleoid-associated protein YgaU
MTQKFEKLQIENIDEGEVFSVLFNPTEYTIEESPSYSSQKRLSQSPEVHYTGKTVKKLSMELFFDTYESKTDVRVHTGKIAKLREFERINDRPAMVVLTWGKNPDNGVTNDFPFVCFLESLRQQFVLFLSNGTPVRAKLSVVFSEYTDTEKERKKNKPSSPDRTKTYIVKAGDTLTGIAGLFYRDSRMWRPIARKNNIPNPRKLEPGRRLTIPPLA